MEKVHDRQRLIYLLLQSPANVNNLMYMFKDQNLLKKDFVGQHIANS